MAELKFGVANSKQKVKNSATLAAFLEGVKILPIYECLDFYAEEKARLRNKGLPIDDFDLLIGTSAVTHDMTLVTNNTRHFKNISKVKIVDWTV